MKRHSLFIFMLPFLLWLAGCEQERPDVLEKLIFSDDDRWLERDTVEDPFELVGGQYCNDYYPYPLPIDTVIHAVINPDDDLDYFDIQITGSYAGQLFLSSERDNIHMRLFSPNIIDMEEYEFLKDTLFGLRPEHSEPVYWTTLYGPDIFLAILIAGESGSAKGDYTLEWRRVIPTTDLDLMSPGGGEQWHRMNRHTIQWCQEGNDPISVALMKGPVMIQSLKQDIRFVNELRWTPPDDLEAGDDYRIMVYLSDDPTTLDISDAFEIY